MSSRVKPFLAFTIVGVSQVNKRNPKKLALSIGAVTLRL